MIQWVVYIWEHLHELWETLQGIFFKFWHYKNQTTNQLIERNFSRISLLSHMNKKCILGSLRAHFNINFTLISQKSINLSAVPPKNGNTQYGYQFKFSVSDNTVCNMSSSHMIYDSNCCLWDSERIWNQKTMVCNLEMSLLPLKHDVLAALL